MIINHTKEAFELQGKAREFAIKAHGDQLYGSKPYIHYLDMVSTTLHSMQDGGWDIPEEAFVAVWLYWVQEDADVGDDALWQEFGETITKAVITMHSPMQSIKDNKIAYVVKVAATLVNLQSSVIRGSNPHFSWYTKQLAKLMDK